MILAFACIARATNRSVRCAHEPHLHTKRLQDDSPLVPSLGGSWGESGHNQNIYLKSYSFEQ